MKRNISFTIEAAVLKRMKAVLRGSKRKYRSASMFVEESILKQVIFEEVEMATRKGTHARTG